MSHRLSLPSFVVGPEPDGRGSGILTQSGLSGATGWQGGLPLVLLEWAKLRSAEGFSGRFAVPGGAIALKAAYFGEGAAGPIARAYGVFINDAALPDILVAERSLFRALPAPTESDAFGRELFDVPLVPDHADPAWGKLGLGWQDRQIIVPLPHSLENIALDALSSIDPPGQRARISGWCTTALLDARGDFLPIQRCNLLVTRPGETLAHERFLPVHFGTDDLSGAAIRPPASYRFWTQLTDMAHDQPEALRDAMGWNADLAGWSDEELAWRFIEILSQHQTAYAHIVGAILAIGDPRGADRPAVSAVTMQNYLLAVADHDRAIVPELMSLFQRAGAGRGDIEAALDDVALAVLDDQLLSQIDDNALLRLIRLLRQKAEAGEIENLQSRLELLDDQSVWRALGRNIRAEGGHEGERRVHLTAIRERLGRGFNGANANIHKLFLRRKLVGHMLNNQGA